MEDVYIPHNAKVGEVRPITKSSTWIILKGPVVYVGLVCYEKMGRDFESSPSTHGYDEFRELLRLYRMFLRRPSH